MYPHTGKSRDVKSGDCGRQTIILPCPIQSKNCAIEVGSNLAMEVWGYLTLLKNEISVHILL